MAQEIERRFLVHKDRLPRLSQGERLVQGYLSDLPHVRFRIINGKTAILCLKKELALGHRSEIEFRREDLSLAELRDLCAMALHPPLAKTRYRVPHENLVWEIDVYEEENEGLITAEVEVPSPDCPIAFPDWIDPRAEITDESRYANINLTRKPFKQW